MLLWWYKNFIHKNCWTCWYLIQTLYLTTQKDHLWTTAQQECTIHWIISVEANKISRKIVNKRTSKIRIHQMNIVPFVYLYRHSPANCLAWCTGFKVWVVQPLVQHDATDFLKVLRTVRTWSLAAIFRKIHPESRRSSDTTCRCWWGLKRWKQPVCLDLGVQNLLKIKGPVEIGKTPPCSRSINWLMPHDGFPNFWGAEQPSARSEFRLGRHWLVTIWANPESWL